MYSSSHTDFFSTNDVNDYICPKIIKNVPAQVLTQLHHWVTLVMTNFVKGYVFRKIC